MFFKYCCSICPPPPFINYLVYIASKWFSFTKWCVNLGQSLFFLLSFVQIPYRYWEIVNYLPSYLKYLLFHLKDAESSFIIVLLLHFFISPFQRFGLCMGVSASGPRCQVSQAPHDPFDD